VSYAFFREEDFVNTQRGKYPKGWKLNRFDSIIVLEYGKGLPELRRKQGRYPVFGSNGIVGYHDRGLVKGPGIVVGRKGTIGAVTYSKSDFWPIDTTYYVRMKTSEVDLNWLFYELVHLNLPRLSSADVVPGLKRELVNNLILPVPSLAEQQRIAAALAIVDSAVELADKVIAKTERLKKGLMQQLLTRGIGHTEYKDTPIGKTPKTWQTIKLEEVCNQRSQIVQPSGEGANRFVGLEHVVSGEPTIQNYGSDMDVRSSKFRFYPKDILYGKLRPYLDKAALADFDGICSTDLLVLTTKQEKALPDFLIYVLHSSEFVKHAVATTTGTNHPRTSWKAISKFEFDLPSVPEQRKIAETFSIVDKKLELERKEKTQLEKVKVGLMDLLLTGKVRIRAD
jgi:type I restriction enzyme S subunit